MWYFMPRMHRGYLFRVHSLCTFVLYFSWITQDYVLLGVSWTIFWQFELDLPKLSFFLQSLLRSIELKLFKMLLRLLFVQQNYLFKGLSRRFLQELLNSNLWQLWYLLQVLQWPFNSELFKLSLSKVFVNWWIQQFILPKWVSTRKGSEFLKIMSRLWHKVLDLSGFDKSLMPNLQKRCLSPLNDSMRRWLPIQLLH